MTVSQLERGMAVEQPRAERAGVAGGAEHGDAMSHGPSPAAVGERRRDLATLGGDLLVGQRPVGGAEREPQRQRDVAGAEPLASR